MAGDESFTLLHDDRAEDIPLESGDKSFDLVSGDVSFDLEARDSADYALVRNSDSLELSL